MYTDDAQRRTDTGTYISTHAYMYVCGYKKRSTAAIYIHTYVLQVYLLTLLAIKIYTHSSSKVLIT